jgi:lipoate-protein ligase B
VKVNIANDLNAAEIIFTTCGLTSGRAAALRAELERNKVCSVETIIADAVAAEFRYARP